MSTLTLLLAALQAIKLEMSPFQSSLGRWKEHPTKGGSGSDETSRDWPWLLILQTSTFVGDNSKIVQTGRLDRTDRDDPAVMNLDAISKFPSRRFGLLQTGCGWLCLKSTYCIGSETASMKINLGYCQCHRHKKAPKWVSVQKLLFNLFRVRSCFNHLDWGFLLHFWRWRSCYTPEEWLSGCGFHVAG